MGTVELLIIFMWFEWDMCYWIITSLVEIPMACDSDKSEFLWMISNELKVDWVRRGYV